MSSSAYIGRYRGRGTEEQTQRNDRLRHCKGPQQHHLPDISRGGVIRPPCDVMTGGPRGFSMPRHFQAPSLFHPVHRDLERNVVLEDPTQDQLCVVYLVLIPLRLWASLSTCLLSAAPGIQCIDNMCCLTSVCRGKHVKPRTGARVKGRLVREVGPRGFVSEIEKSPEISGGFHHFLRRSLLYCLLDLSLSFPPTTSTTTLPPSWSRKRTSSMSGIPQYSYPSCRKYYDLLEVQPDASESDLKKAYRKK
jgi:hypothetical protein